MAQSNLPRYQPGDRVRVSSEAPAGHCRTPRYVQGMEGIIRKLHGSFRNPESLAYGGPGLPRQPLYSVELEQCKLWAKYQGPSTDKLWVDLYQHWLSPMKETQ